MTGPYVTLAERKAERERATAEAVRSLEEILAEFAGEHGGRYILFGSAAAGPMGHHSDVDLIVDFPPEHRSAAILFAEEEIWKRRLLPDVRAVDYCSDALLRRALEQGRILA